MAAKSDTKAKCLLCNADFSKTGMTKHLKACLNKQSESQAESQAKSQEKKKPFFHIMVDGLEHPRYWMHLKVAADAKLADLDKFLRDTWLECCGHLSAFNSPEGELDMKKKIKDVVKPGTVLDHEYDFGDTTILRVKVIDLREGVAEKKKIHLLARNDPPEILCNICGKAPAVKVCSQCIWDGQGWLCKKCVKKHDCDEEMLLPVVNSPRTGICGYTG